MRWPPLCPRELHKPSGGGSQGEQRGGAGAAFLHRGGAHGGTNAAQPSGEGERTDLRSTSLLRGTESCSQHTDCPERENRSEKGRLVPGLESERSVGSHLAVPFVIQ